MNFTSIFIYVVIGGLLLIMVICAIIQSIMDTKDGTYLPPEPRKKDKSVIKGGIVGGIIGGVPGAIVGALSQKSKIDTENTEAIIDAINKTKK